LFGSLIDYGGEHFHF